MCAAALEKARSAVRIDPRDFRGVARGTAVLPRSPHDGAGQALHVALDRGSLFAFPLLRGLLVEFTPAQLGENPGLLASAFETPQGGIKILVLTNTNARHLNLNSLMGMRITPTPIGTRRDGGRGF